MIDLSVVPAEEEILAELGKRDGMPAGGPDHPGKGSLTLTRNKLYHRGACYLVPRSRQFMVYRKNRPHRIDVGSIMGISAFRHRMIFWFLAGAAAIITSGFSILKMGLELPSSIDYYGAGIQVLFLAMGILWVIRYFQLRKKELLVIETGEFGLGVDKSWYDADELAVFDRKLREQLSSVL